MKTLIIYDSNFGNTQLIAEEIAKNLAGSAKAIHVKNFNKTNLEDIDLFIIGSPIIAWRPTEAILALLNTFNANNLKSLNFTTFDTRVKLFHGDAKDKIANTLNNTGAKLITEPIAFYVSGKQGPLFEGELEKATEWAKSINAKLQ
jgi:flavodoxin